MRFFTKWMFVLFLFYAPSAGAQETVFTANPGDDIQAIVDDACQLGGGATIQLAEGTYPLTKTLILSCSNITLKGAGMDVTKIVWDGVDRPLSEAVDCIGPNTTGVYIALIAAGTFDANGTMITFCGIPDPSQVIQNITVKDLTVQRAPTSQGISVTGGIMAFWADNLTVKNVHVNGFTGGIEVEGTSDNLVVADSIIDSTDATINNAFCVSVQAPSFQPNTTNTLQVRPHTMGVTVQNITGMNCANGVSLVNVIGATVHHSTFKQNIVGVRAVAGDDHDFHHLTIKDPRAVSVAGSRGITLQQVNNTSIHHNAVCGTAFGVRYNGRSALAAALGFPDPSEGDLVHHNTWFGVLGSPPVSVTDPNFIGVNMEFKNEVESLTLCPD